MAAASASSFEDRQSDDVFVPSIPAEIFDLLAHSVCWPSDEGEGNASSARNVLLVSHSCIESLFAVYGPNMVLSAAAPSTGESDHITQWHLFMTSPEADLWKFDDTHSFADIIPTALEHIGITLQDGEWNVVLDQLRARATMSSRHRVHAGREDEGTRRQVKCSRFARSNTSQSVGGSRASRASSRSRTGNRSDRSEGQGSGENEQLREQLAKAKARSRAAAAEVKTLKQQVRRQGKIIDTLKADLAVARGSHKSLEVTRVSDTDVMKGKSGSWLTPSGAVSLAAARLSRDKKSILRLLR